MLTLYHYLDPIADSINPALSLTAIVIAVFEFRAGRRRSAIAFAIATLLGVCSMYAVRAVWRGVFTWQRHYIEYSSHAAFATTIALSIFVWRQRLRVAICLLWAAYLALIVAIGYHTLRDVAIAAMIGVVVTLPWHLKARAVESR